MISKIAATMLYHSNRKASQRFQNIADNPEDFSKFKFVFPLKKAIHMKIKFKLSDRQYKLLKKFLSENISLPSQSKIAEETSP